MALFVDCAFLTDVQPICARYPVSGVTTNPSILLAAAQRAQHLSDIELVRELLQVCRGPIFMQPMAGAHDVTAPPELIRSLLEDPLTSTALEQFSADWEKLRAAVAQT